MYFTRFHRYCYKLFLTVLKVCIAKWSVTFLKVSMILARLLRHAESSIPLTSEVLGQAFIESESVGNKYSMEILLFLFMWVLRSKF